MDVHPLPAPATTPMGEKSQQVILNVSGKVKIGDDRGKNLLGFAAVLYLKQDPVDSNKSYISSMSYRYIYKPDDSTILMQ